MKESTSKKGQLIGFCRVTHYKIKMAFLPNMTKETLATLMEMLQTGELCDLLVKGNDDTKVHKIHALVLASASSKLTKHCDRTPGKENVLPFSGRVLEEVIKLSYHGNCDINEAILVEAIDVSTKYKLEIMKSCCKMFLLNNLTVSNMLDFFRIAKNIPGDNCQFLILKFLARNIKTLTDDAINALPKEDIKALLGHLSLNLTSDEATRMVYAWIAANRGTKCTVINQLKSLAQIPTKRRIPKNVILSVGGWTNNPCAVIEYFNPLTKKWRVTTDKKFALSRMQLANITYCGLEIIGKCLYLIGGYSTSNNHQDGRYLNTLFEFNLESKEWTQKTSMSENRCYVSTAVHQNKLYAFGGRGSGPAPGRLSTAEVFDPETNQWTAISNMIHGRSSSASVTYEGSILLIGGYDGVTCLNSIDRYNPETDTWSNVGHMTTPRAGASAVTLGDKIYVMGGVDDLSPSMLSSVECFSFGAGLANLTWHTVPDMIDCRSYFAACVEEDKIVVAGGFKTINGFMSICKDVEVFHPRENIWKSSSDLNVARAAMASVNCDNEELNLN